MTYFLISLTNKCNKSCDYCVVKQWRNNPAYPDKITAEDVIAFLAKEARAGDIVELTGGEPTLFPNLNNLLDFCKELRLKVIMRTNGLNLGEWRKEYDNLTIVFAKHDSSEEYMEKRKKHLFSQDIIEEYIDGKKVSSDSLVPEFKTNDTSPLNSHGITKPFFITADGNVRFMPCVEQSWGNIIGLQYKREEHYCLDMQTCPYMLGAWNLQSFMQ